MSAANFRDGFIIGFSDAPVGASTVCRTCQTAMIYRMRSDDMPLKRGSAKDMRTYPHPGPLIKEHHFRVDHAENIQDARSVRGIRSIIKSKNEFLGLNIPGFSAVTFGQVSFMSDGFKAKIQSRF